MRSETKGGWRSQLHIPADELKALHILRNRTEGEPLPDVAPAFAALCRLPVPGTKPQDDESVARPTRRTPNRSVLTSQRCQRSQRPWAASTPQTKTNRLSTPRLSWESIAHGSRACHNFRTWWSAPFSLWRDVFLIGKIPRCHNRPRKSFPWPSTRALWRACGPQRL